MNDSDRLNKEELVNFIIACNEFIDGKFILVDIKISKILRAISQSALVYDLVAENLINYDFKKELENVSESLVNKEKENLEIPKERNFIIPFVFSLLVEIDSKKIDFDEFLTLFFPIASSQKEEYECFAKEIILPFRDAVAESFDIDVDSLMLQLNTTDEEVKDIFAFKLDNKIEPQETVNLIQHEEEKKIEEDNNEDEPSLLFDHLARTASIVKDKSVYVKNSLKQSNIALLAEALQEACKLKNLTICSALIMSLDSLAKKERCLKQELNEINNICYELFS